MISDKEVGALWIALRNPQKTLMAEDAEKIVQALIRKLVAERARWREFINSRCVGPCAENEARRDFGIDPTTWEGK